jgi:hypothetical protein
VTGGSGIEPNEGRRHRRSAPGRTAAASAGAAPLDDADAFSVPHNGAGSAARPASVEPITHAAATGRDEQIPPPPEPPPLDDEPPPDHQGPSPATVDPITGR